MGKPVAFIAFEHRSQVQYLQFLKGLNRVLIVITHSYVQAQADGNHMGMNR